MLAGYGSLGNFVGVSFVVDTRMERFDRKLRIADIIFIISPSLMRSQNRVRSKILYGKDGSKGVDLILPEIMNCMLLWESNNFALKNVEIINSVK